MQKENDNKLQKRDLTRVIFPMLDRPYCHLAPKPKRSWPKRSLLNSLQAKTLPGPKRTKENSSSLLYSSHSSLSKCLSKSFLCEQRLDGHWTGAGILGGKVRHCLLNINRNQAGTVLNISRKGSGTPTVFSPDNNYVYII